MLVLGIAVAVSLIAVLLCETDTLPVGVLSGRGGSDEFVLTMLMELLTLCAIPLALRLFRFKAIAARLGDDLMGGKPLAPREDESPHSVARQALLDLNALSPGPDDVRGSYFPHRLEHVKHVVGRLVGKVLG